MKKRFTFGELLLVVFCLAVLAALASGAAGGRAARGVRCADKMRALLQISHQYVTDHRGMWMAPCNTKNGAYVRALSQGKYLKSSWRTLMTARETEITCPDLPRVSRYKTMQGYGSVYNNGSSYDPQVGIYIYSPEYSFIGTGKARRSVPQVKRIWFLSEISQGRRGLRRGESHPRGARQHRSGRRQRDRRRSGGSARILFAADFEQSGAS